MNKIRCLKVVDYDLRSKIDNLPITNHPSEGIPEPDMHLTV